MVKPLFGQDLFKGAENLLLTMRNGVHSEHAAFCQRYNSLFTHLKWAGLGWKNLMSHPSLHQSG